MKIPINGKNEPKMEIDFSKLNLDSFNFSTLDVNLTYRIMNAASKVGPDLIEKYTNNRSINNPGFWILIVMYSVVIVFGALGNSLVVLAVARKPAMRTARNMFILNLAISDLLLCLVTTPLTLMEILTKHWPLTKQVFICKIIGALQATSIFVSSISITAIALDRYQVIIYPTHESLQVMGAMCILGIIWTIAIIFACPMFIYRELKTLTVNVFGIEKVSFCMEDWPIDHGRAVYSAFSLVVQYLVPIIIVSVAYIRIYFKLKYRYVSTNMGNESARDRERGRRMQKTNSLLVSIAVIYCISWLPLNLFNLFEDLYHDPDEDQQKMLIGYAICHMMGMSSACSNPMLYGWLNDNFKKEFQEILFCFYRQRRQGSSRKGNMEMSQQHMAKITRREETTENGVHMTTADTEMTVLAR